MREYAVENGKPVDLKELEASALQLSSYKITHQSLPIACHDVFIDYRGGILLVTRNSNPARGALWPLGGRVQRGTGTEESLRMKVLKESNLKLEGIVEIGHARTFFGTDPFNHNRGTDTINFVYTAQCKGALRLDGDHRNPVLITPRMHTTEFKAALHPYVRDFLEIAMKSML